MSFFYRGVPQTLTRYAIYDLEPALFVNIEDYLLSVSKYVSLTKKSLSNSVSIPFKMDSQTNHLRHVMLHCFKKGNSAKGTVNEICTVYRNGATTIEPSEIGLRNLDLTILI